MGSKVQFLHGPATVTVRIHVMPIISRTSRIESTSLKETFLTGQRHPFRLQGRTIMNLRKAAVILILLLIPYFSFASGQQEAVETEAAGELRAVSLAPNLTETIFALGKGDCLVGRTDWCNYPPEVSDIATVGSIQEPSVEAIIELQPDIIFASTHAPKDAADQLTKAGLEVRYYYSESSFEGGFDVIRAVGADLGADAEPKPWSMI